MPGTVDLTDLDMRARAVPYGEFARRRREAPVAWSGDEGSGFWPVTRYSDIVAGEILDEQLGIRAKAWLRGRVQPARAGAGTAAAQAGA